jgi:hemoglobin/transferrin/lactoferrin receptor protein
VVTNVVAPDTFPVRDFPLSETDEYALFVQDEIAFLDGRLTIVPGLRYDRFELEPEVDPVFVADNPGIVPVAIEDDNLSPKLGASLSLTDAWSLHANYAQGFRAPPYNDANIGFTNLQFGYTAIPNPDLKSEESEGIELGVRVSGDMGFATLAVYRNEYDDFIESLRSLGVDPVGGLLVFQSQNIASVTIEGAELRGALDLGTLAGAFGGFTLHTAMSYARGDDDEADRPLNSIDPPRAVAGIRYDAPDQRWNVELAATAVSDKDRVDDSFGVQFRTPGYTTFDLFGQYRFGTRARVDAGVFNLTDKFYWEWADVRGRLASDPVIARFTAPGRNVAINLVVDLP